MIFTWRGHLKKFQLQGNLLVFPKICTLSYSVLLTEEQQRLKNRRAVSFLRKTLLKVYGSLKPLPYHVVTNHLLKKNI